MSFRFTRPTTRLAALAISLFLGTAAPAAVPPVEFNPRATPFLQLLWARLGDLNGEAGAVESAEFSPDGQYIVSGGKYDNSLVVWRVLDGTVVWRRVLDDEIERAGFSPDGRHVVSAGEDETLRLWNAADGTPVTSVPLDAAVDGMAFSPDGSTLVTGKEGGVVQAWSFPDMRLLRSTNVGGTVNSVAFNRDGSLVFLGGHPHHVHVLRSADFSPVHKWDGVAGLAVISVRLAEDKGLVAAGQYGGYVNVWRLSDGSRVARYNLNGRKVEAVAWSPDGNHLLSAGLDEHIRVVRTADLGMENIPIAHTSPPAGRTEYLDFSPNGGTLVSAHEDGTVRLWLWKSGDEDFNIKHHRALMKRQKADAAKRQSEREAKGIKSR